MQLNDKLIRNVVQEVLAAMGQTAAAAAQAEFEKRSIEDREKAVACIRRICRDQAEELGRMEYEETQIGRLENKPEKLRVVADRIPGTEFLKTETYSGSQGVALIE